MIPKIAGLPPLDWTSARSHASYHPADSALTLTAAPGVDWTNDPLGGEQQHRASALGFAAPAAFSLSARVLVTSPRTTFDAGVLSVWADRDHWAKLCFEYSPRGEAMVVSVVTNTYSDDSNGPVVRLRGLICGSAGLDRRGRSTARVTDTSGALSACSGWTRTSL